MSQTCLCNILYFCLTAHSYSIGTPKLHKGTFTLLSKDRIGSIAVSFNGKLSQPLKYFSTVITYILNAGTCNIVH